MLNGVDLSRLDLNLLVLFEAVLAERHVARAADRLNLSPSAVSHGLGRLRRLLNDPLFLRTPKGVVPTDRALELAEPIGEILARIRSVVSTAEPFEPKTSKRRFTLGAPDGVLAVFLPGVLETVIRTAPGIDISLRQVLPLQGDTSPDRAWRNTFADIETRTIDIAVVPLDEVPARFLKVPLYEEEFVIAMRSGHHYAQEPTLDRYCEMQHLVVSASGDPFGFVDRALAEHGRLRRVVLTAPNFMLGLSTIADSDLISAMPKRFLADHAARFGVVWVETPVPLSRFILNAVTSRAAMLDKGLAWMLDTLARQFHSAEIMSRDQMRR